MHRKRGIKRVLMRKLRNFAVLSIILLVCLSCYISTPVEEAYFKHVISAYEDTENTEFTRKIIIDGARDGVLLYSLDGGTLWNEYSEYIVALNGTIVKAKYESSPVVDIVCGGSLDGLISYSIEDGYGDYVYVTIWRKESGIHCIYTIDGSVPSADNGKTLSYSGQKLTVEKGSVINVSAGIKSLDLFTNIVPLFTINGEPLPAPTIMRFGADALTEVTISSVTDGAKIYYSTISTIPDENDQEYTGPITVNIGDTVYARAYKDGCWSYVAELKISPYIAEPEITSSYYSTSFCMISMTCADDNAAIYYTLDGSDPTVYNSNRYYSSFVAPTYSTVKAAAYKDGYWSDVVSHYVEELLPEPTITVSKQTSGYARITLSIEDSDAVIYYTTDKTTPNSSSPVYTGFFNVANGTTVKARAYKNGCWSDVVSYTYTNSYNVGDTGPAGGYIFYDKGYYSDGWRYLEAAKNDIGAMLFGYYRNSSYGTNYTVGTSTAIGRGKANTEKLVNAMGSYAYSSSSGSSKTSNYAAMACYNYSYGGYDDWFLPSRNELDLMYDNLKSKGIGAFSVNNYYWSSSEYSNDGANYALCLSFSDGDYYYSSRYNDWYVRPCRAF